MRLLSTRRTGRLAVAVTVAALALAACGDQEGTTDSASPAPTSAADPALAAKVPAAVKADGKIIVGTDASYAPSEFLDTDGKTVVGFDVDLFTAVAGKLGLKAAFQPSTFDTIIPGVESGKYEIGVSSFTVNDERKKVVNMVSYFSAGTQWATKKGNPGKIDPDNACGKKVAVQTATVQETEDLPKRQAACTAAGKPKIQVDSYEGQDQATAAVASGKDDAMLADSPVGAYAVEKTKGQLELLGEIYDAAPYGYVVKLEQTEFAQAIADAVKALVADGTYAKVLEKWGVDAGALKDPALNP